jgi:imidazole glycerol-phosphate synthase subunit HisH
MITIVDYGLGNVRALLNMYKRMNIDAVAASTADALGSADRLILPGVGAFDHAMDLLDASGMRDTLEELVRGKRVPVLGICVGMQMLAEGSDEGVKRGLGWVPGRVRALSGRAETKGLPLPHMGWNDVDPAAGEKLFAGMDAARFYFLHSFYFECADAARCSVATARYGVDFTCAVRNDRVAGVQFHPEKSHHWGAGLLRNFALQD